MLWETWAGGHINESKISYNNKLNARQTHEVFAARSTVLVHFDHGANHFEKFIRELRGDAINSALFNLGRQLNLIGSFKWSAK